MPAERIVFSGVGKRRDEIRAALEAGVRSLNVESLGELDVVAEEAGALGVVAPVSVRLNPDVEADTHAYVATGSARSKFGLRPARRATCRATSAHAPIRRSSPSASRSTSARSSSTPRPSLAAAEPAAELWRELAAEGIALRDLDVGGGLGVAYEGERSAAVEPYAADARERRRGAWRRRSSSSRAAGSSAPWGRS